jgi:predicted GNAT family acetyltransferase
MPEIPTYAIRDNVEKQRFEADVGDGSLAIAEYRIGDGRIAFTHTEVPHAHGGRGIGTALIRFALNWARNRGLKVAPICPFVAAFIKAHVEEQDLLDPAWRAELGLA